MKTRTILALGLILALLAPRTFAQDAEEVLKQRLEEALRQLEKQRALVADAQARQAELLQREAAQRLKEAQLVRPLPGKAGQPGKVPVNLTPQDSVNLVFLGDKKPVLIRLNVFVEGKSVQTYWNEHFEKWYRYLDVKKDGMFTDEDLKLAPNTFGLNNVMRQGGFFLPGRGDHLSLAQLGKQAGDKVTLEEFQAYYRTMIPGIQVLPAFNNDALYAQAGNALFKILDTNNDGKLSKEEILAANKTLRKLDLDDDEWITLAELVPNFGNNNGNFGLQPRGGPVNGGGSPQINEAFFNIRPGEDLIGQLLLDRYDRQKVQRLTRLDLDLDKETFAKLDKNGDGALDRDELNAWHERPADVEFTLHVGANNLVDIVKTQMPFLPFVTQKSPGIYQLTAEDAQISVGGATSRQQPGNLIAFPQPGQNQFLLQQFRQADKKKNDFLEMDDVAGQQFQVLRSAFPYLDRDKDGKLTKAEVEAFVSLQTGFAGRSVTISVAEHGRAFFQLLDSNRDGRLSQRELLDAWKVLEQLDKDKTGFINPTDIARQFTIGVQRGTNNNFNGFVVVNGGVGLPNQGPVAVRYPEGTPDWFRKMDRNSDGDVSRAEFLGTREEFDRIDTNHDGLISPDEAIRYDATRRKAK